MAAGHDAAIALNADVIGCIWPPPTDKVRRASGRAIVGSCMECSPGSREAMGRLEAAAASLAGAQRSALLMLWVSTRSPRTASGLECLQKNGTRAQEGAQTLRRT